MLLSQGCYSARHNQTVHNQTVHFQPDNALSTSVLHFMLRFLCKQTVQSTCLEAWAVALTASRREADSLALELDSSISIARSVSACMKIGHTCKSKEMGKYGGTPTLIALVYWRGDCDAQHETCQCMQYSRRGYDCVSLQNYQTQRRRLI